jgi:hypothetical protein
MKSSYSTQMVSEDRVKAVSPLKREENSKKAEKTKAI